MPFFSDVQTVDQAVCPSVGPQTADYQFHWNCHEGAGLCQQNHIQT